MWLILDELKGFLLPLGLSSTVYSSRVILQFWWFVKSGQVSAKITEIIKKVFPGGICRRPGSSKLHPLPPVLLHPNSLAGWDGPGPL